MPQGEDQGRQQDRPCRPSQDGLEAQEQVAAEDGLLRQRDDRHEDDGQHGFGAALRFQEGGCRLGGRQSGPKQPAFEHYGPEEERDEQYASHDDLFSDPTKGPADPSDPFAVSPKKEQNEADEAEVAEDGRHRQQHEAQAPLSSDKQRQHQRRQDKEKEDGHFNRLFPDSDRPTAIGAVGLVDGTEQHSSLTSRPFRHRTKRCCMALHRAAGGRGPSLDSF